MRGSATETAQQARRRQHVDFGLKFGLAWCGLLALLGVLATHGQTASTSKQSWALGPWTRASQEPVIRPNPASVFADPLSGEPVHWEALHTFTPVAVVRNGRVWVLYRAEDNSGAMAIGGHVPRLGLASSPDGVHFDRMPQPVFFPADDAQRSRE